MREMYKKLVCATVLLSAVFAFSACSDDKDDLALDKSEISVNQGETVVVKITSGNGGYAIVSANESIATATVSNNEITVVGVKGGETTLTLTDSEKKSSVIKATVISLAEQIAATYDGALTIMGEEVEKDIALAISGENVKLTLADFSFGIMSLGDIVVDGIALSKANGTITLAETKTTLALTLFGMDVELPIQVNGSVKDGTLDLTILVTNVPPTGSTIPVEFSGKAGA